MLKITKKLLSMTFLTLPFTVAQAHNLNIDTMVETRGNIYRVIDGDTFQINIDSHGFSQLVERADNDPEILEKFNEKYHSIIVRLANVDTEESEHEDASRNTQKGKETSNHVTQLVEGKDAILKCYDFGDHHRAICTVAFEYEGQMIDLGGYLIKNDFSDYETYFGNNPFYHNTYRSF